MYVTLGILVEIILVLLGVSGFLLSRYLSQRKTLKSYLDIIEQPLPKPKVSPKQAEKVIDEHLSKALTECETQFASGSGPLDPSKIDGETELDQDALVVAIRHALLSAEQQALKEHLHPKNGDLYWVHFNQQMKPILDSFNTLTEKAVQKKELEWQEKWEQHQPATDDELSLNQEATDQATTDAAGASEAEWEETLANKEREWQQKLDAKEQETQTQLENNRLEWQAKLDSLNSDWQTKLDAQNNDWQKQLDSQNSDWQTKLDSQNSDWQTKLDSQNSDWQTKVAEQENLYQEKLDNQEQSWQERLSTEEQAWQAKLEAQESTWQDKLYNKEISWQKRLERAQNNTPSDSDEIADHQLDNSENNIATDEQEAVLAQQSSEMEQTLASLQSTLEDLTAENQLLKNQLDSYNNSDSVALKKDIERQNLDAAIAAAMAFADSSEDISLWDAEDEVEPPTVHELELQRLKDRAEKQQLLSNDLLNNLEEIQTHYQQQHATDPSDTTDLYLERLTALRDEMAQLNKMNKESDMVLSILENNINNLTTELDAAKAALLHAEDQLIEAKTELRDTASAAQLEEPQTDEEEIPTLVANLEEQDVSSTAISTDTETVEALQQELIKAKALHTTLLEYNSDSAIIIQFIRQALETPGLSEFAEDILDVFNLFNIKGAVQLTGSDKRITKETFGLNTITSVRDSFKRMDKMCQGFIYNGDLTMLYYPNLKLLVQGLQSLDRSHQVRIKEVLPIIGHLADELIHSINNAQEVELNRARLKQTIVAVHQSAKNIDIRLKLFFKESAFESDNLFKTLRNQAFINSLNIKDREKYLGILSEGIKSSKKLLEKHRANNLVKQLLLSVDPVLSEIRGNSRPSQKS